MGRDYYKTLNLSANCTVDDVKRAYRKLALKYHPQKNAEESAKEKFLQIAEAYDVLSDNRKRAVYDQFGEEGLKAGVPHGFNRSGAHTEGYTFHGDPLRVFLEFFGNDNPFREFFDRVDGDMHMSFGGLHGRGQKKKDEPIERDLVVSLEEIFHGCVKKMKIARRVMNEDGHTSSVREKILTIVVKRGWRQGTKITFPEEGDQGPNNVPADIVFVVKDKPHPRFRREGSDLIYTADIPLGRALTSYTVNITTLDDRVLHIPITDIVHPTFVKTVPGEGMPLPENPAQKGDLHIRFNVQFPTKLSAEQRKAIADVLC
ncbi:hypothetical protein BOX15_Mlig016125g3 [Macrostomum lignano]|uniref:Uncharacterized protein n=2 Tax=Macrostomum lignano TaxID=282301 RepID=A0A267F615_9PLAT|nr:hypothetical protein BOX15_Mlig016125g2 [Macrostomum lignano]PAA68472.1 hypothetical protein BOX15_Mlig016125g1 [Macrostomum lignano]PAA81549.1 hypothetical protein BOX15_Mlig016125g3 [Macrostomum lignano]